MDKKQFLQGIEKIQLAYNITFNSEKLKLWYENLKNMDYEKYINRVEELIKTSKYVPNIAEILNNEKGYSGRDYSNFNFDTLYANL